MDILIQNYIPGIIASLIAAFIVWCIKNVILSFHERSDFNGYWESCLYNNDNQLIKKDRIKIKHNKKTDSIHGKANRIIPESDDSKKWKVSGILKGKDIICLIWSTQSFVSLNCSYLHQTENEEYKYEGYCLKNVDDKIEKYKIILRKVKRYK